METFIKSLQTTNHIPNSIPTGIRQRTSSQNKPMDWDCHCECQCDCDQCVCQCDCIDCSIMNLD